MKVSRWKVKAIAQKIISFLPMKERINYLFQRYVTKGILLTDSYFEGKLIHARDHLRFFREYGSGQGDFTVLELGTGWYPVIPICMYLSGARDVTSVDIQSWMTRESLMTTIRTFLAWQRSGRIDEYLELTLEDRWRTLRHIADNEKRYGKEWICGGLRLTLMLGDARRADIAPKSFDLICSNNTFEHVHRDVLKGLLVEFGRMIKEGGVMSHFIDMSDHFAHTDREITIYNFLRYSDRMWRRIDNDIQPQNRLRLVDYRQLYETLQLPITHEIVRPGDVNALAGIQLAERFRAYAQEELAISHAHLVSKIP